jgi:hypothetical protein
MAAWTTAEWTTGARTTAVPTHTRVNATIKRGEERARMTTTPRQWCRGRRTRGRRRRGRARGGDSGADDGGAGDSVDAGGTDEEPPASHSFVVVLLRDRRDREEWPRRVRWA